MGYNYYNANVNTILAKLERVRAVGTGRWVACCPAHPDKNPSLSIRETPEGKILLFCFARCRTEDVLAALGIKMSDLFPYEAYKNQSKHPGRVQEKKEIKRNQAAKILLRTYEKESLRLACELGAILREMEKLVKSKNFWLFLFSSGDSYMAEKIAKSFHYLDHLFREVAMKKNISPVALSEIKKEVRKWKPMMETFRKFHASCWKA